MPGKEFDPGQPAHEPMSFEEVGVARNSQVNSLHPVSFLHQHIDHDSRVLCLLSSMLASLDSC